jgi:hypothetical protein
MDPEISFFFYLAAIICFVIAAIGDAWKYGGGPAAAGSRHSR